MSADRYGPHKHVGYLYWLFCFHPSLFSWAFVHYAGYLLSLMSGVSFLYVSEQAPACIAQGCQFNCSVTHDGPRCYCSAGYEVTADGRTCKGEWVVWLLCSANRRLEFCPITLKACSVK